MRNRLKVVVTGGSGLLATNLAVLKKDEWDIHLLVHKRNVIIDGVSTLKVSLDDICMAKEIIRSIAPDLIIHTAGLTNVDMCEQFRYKAYIGNVLLAKNIAIIANELRVSLVHISTDHFSSGEAYSNEIGISLPLNVYAKTKLEAAGAKVELK